MRIHIVFDIGAHTGVDSLSKAASGSIVYAFEPVPELANHIRSTIRLPNYHVYQVACSDFNGMGEFNITGNWASSSLLELHENASQVWNGTADLSIKQKINVQVVRLDSFIESYKIPWIDYLHIDTQGNDLKVLEGLGEYIQIVREGCVEVPVSHDRAVYKNQHSKQQMIEFLQMNSFEIQNIVNQDPLGNEQNIYFRRT